MCYYLTAFCLFLFVLRVVEEFGVIFMGNTSWQLATDLNLLELFNWAGSTLKDGFCVDLFIIGRERLHISAVAKCTLHVGFFGPS